MNKLTLIFLGLTGTLLAACNVGSSNSSSSDTKSGMGSTTVNNSTFSISYYIATGCRDISAGGTCILQLNNYTATNDFAGALSLSALNGYVSNISHCTIAGTLSHSCTVTITANNNAQVTTAQTFGIIANSQSSSQITNITIGGGN